MLSACRYYFQKTGRRLTFEYSLVGGRPSRGQMGGYWLAAGLWVRGMVGLGGGRRGKENAGGRSAVRLAGLFAGYALAFLVLLPRP